MGKTEITKNFTDNQDYNFNLLALTPGFQVCRQKALNLYSNLDERNA